MTPEAFRGSYKSRIELAAQPRRSISRADERGRLDTARMAIWSLPAAAAASALIPEGVTESQTGWTTARSGVSAERTSPTGAKRMPTLRVARDGDGRRLARPSGAVRCGAVRCE